MLPKTTKAEISVENIDPEGEDEFFLTVSPLMQKLRAQAELLAQASVPVLILGEAGSGKGTVARLIHRLSVYSGFKFTRINCAETPAELLELEVFGGNRESWFASSHGKFEISETGTLLLDEIAEMPDAMQARLAQLLHEHQSLHSHDTEGVHAGMRILAASSDDLNRALAEKKLRSDLYYRLSAFTIRVPPLRQRKEEISILLRYSMHKLARYYRLPAREFSSTTLATCESHSWPGNLKELQTFVKRYLVAGDRGMALSGFENFAPARDEFLSESQNLSEIATETVDAETGVATTRSLKSLVQGVKSEAEKRAIALALEKTGWNRKAAARLLGVSYRAILYKIEHYHMSDPEDSISALAESQLTSVGPVKARRRVS